MIDRAVVLVGRGAECDVVIDFSSKISRMHCILVQVDADHYVRDLGSMNGVWLNGERVKREAKLTQGDTIAIGDVAYQFHANVQPPPRVALRSGGRGTGSPVPIQEPVEVLDVEVISDDLLDAQIVENIEFVDAIEVIDDVYVVDDLEVIDAAEVIHDVEVMDAAEVIHDVDVIEDAEVIEDVDIIEDVDVIHEVDLIDDIEVIDDVETISNEAKHRPRRPPRLR